MRHAKLVAVDVDRLVQAGQLQLAIGIGKGGADGDKAANRQRGDGDYEHEHKHDKGDSDEWAAHFQFLLAVRGIPIALFLT